MLLSRGGELWGFHGAFGKHITDGLHTRAYLLNERDGTWQLKGKICDPAAITSVPDLSIAELAIRSELGGA